MCRILGYLGTPVPLSSLVYAPPHALRVQSYAPRRQEVGLINADGWGIGWYDPSVADRPARYRTSTPMWADERFAGIADHVRAGHVVAAVRSATPGLPVEESGASPFVMDRWLFTHNGAVQGWNDGIGRELRGSLSPRREAQVTGRADSEVLFAMVLDRVDAGAPVEAALREVVARVQDLAECRLTFLLADGTTIWATRVRNSLWSLDGDLGRTLASEPHDDDPRWTEVPECSLLRLDAAGLVVEPL